MASQDAGSTSPQKTDSRFVLAVAVIAVAGGGIIALAIIVLWSSGENLPNSADKIFSSVLPLFGTWVGTVLAFYFSKENFESASQSVQQMAARLTSMEKLESIPVSSELIPAADIVPMLKLTATEGAAQTKLIDNIQELFDSADRNRLPVVNEQLHPLYIIHRSMIDRFLARKAGTGLTAQELSALTLKDVLDAPEFKKTFEQTFVCVSPTDTLGDAKKKMDARPGCSDVFVTADGTKASPLEGWLTNWIISKNAQV